MDGEKFIAQHRVALLRVDAQHQRGEAGDLLQTGHQLVGFRNAAAVDHKADQNLFGNRAAADVNMPQQTLMGHFVIDGYMISVYIIHDNGLDLIGFFRQDQAALVFHHFVGACLEETGIGAVFLSCHRILSLVAVAVTGGCCQNRHGLQVFAAQTVQAVAYPF